MKVIIFKHLSNLPTRNTDTALVFAWQHQLMALALEMAVTLGLVGYGLWTWVLRGEASREGPPVAEAVHARPPAVDPGLPSGRGRRRADVALDFDGPGGG